MTYQEILEAICRHRANPPSMPLTQDAIEIRRKFDEIEWALQAIAEKLRDKDTE